MTKTMYFAVLLAAPVLSLVFAGCSPMLIGSFVSIPTTSGPTIYAWGNSQTQGYGIDGCVKLTCHPAHSWPQFFANSMGWTLNNQAYGSSDCADLTYQGTSLSLWDLNIGAGSRNIYGHFRNDQSQFGPLPYRVAYARGCIEAQTAWLAIPEANKVRAAATTSTGSWSNATQNSVAAFTGVPGATKTFVVTGTTVYLATARVNSSANTRYTVSVDGSIVTDPETSSITFTQDLDVGASSGFPTSQAMIQNFIRIPGLEEGPHNVVYTCTVPASTGCYIFYAAGISSNNSTANAPVVYSLSPVPNSFKGQVGYMNASTTLIYHDAWQQMVTELTGDGLHVIGIDATDPNVYSPTADSQPDGIHPNLVGHTKIAAGAVKAAEATSR